MISDAEASIQRRNTTVFIAADAELVALVPVTSTRTTSGGTTSTESPALPSQVMRLIPSGEFGATTERFLMDGTLVKPEYTLLGSYNAQMERGYRFVLGGNRYEIVFVHEKRDYETKGEVVYLGRA